MAPSAAAPCCLWPQETSPGPTVTPRLWSLFTSISAPMQGSQRRAEHHRDAREKERVLQHWSAPEVGTAHCRTEENPRYSSSLPQTAPCYSLLSTDASLQISMPVHPSLICTLGNKGRRQDPPLSTTFTAGKASRPILHPKPLHVVLNLPPRDRELRAAGREHAGQES